MKKKIAIIGASTGQLPLCLKAKEMGLETYCFAWPKGAVCKDYVDCFVPISIFELDEIVKYCKLYHIDGVVSNASEATALVVSYVAEKLGKICTPYDNFKKIQNKVFVRETTNNIPELQCVEFRTGSFEKIISSFPRPFVIKPIKGDSKKGVSFIDEQINESFVPDEWDDVDFMAESYVCGKEYSVECISYHGHHEVIQITEKIGTGAPHFVEIGHNQPALLLEEEKREIRRVIPKILSSIGFVNGASHIEIKIDDLGRISLIELNPRGGGDEISNKLIQLSTGFDFLRAIIEVALDMFQFSTISHNKYAGIYYLCRQSIDWLPFFFFFDYQPWLVEKKLDKKIDINSLHHSISNYDRDGYVIYNWEKRIVPTQHADVCVRKLNIMPNGYELGYNFLQKINEEEKNREYDIPNSWLQKIFTYADILVYMDKSVIQGWCVLYCNDKIKKYAYIAGLYVLSEYRQKGIAKILLEYSVDICRGRRFDVLGLYCNNPIAIKLYIRYCFIKKEKKNVDRLGGQIYSYMELHLK